MDGVAKRVEDCGNLVADFFMYRPDVFFRHKQIAGEATIGIDAEDFDFVTNVTVASAALLALSAGDMPFRTDAGSFADSSYCGSGFFDNPAEFMAGRDADLDPLLAPLVPFEDVAVGPANSRVGDAYQDVSGARFRQCHFGHKR
jgi:hypothetical protein